MSAAVIAMTTAANKRHHRALRKVEYAGGLEDQHEAERNERVEHARQEPPDENFQKLTEDDHAHSLMTDAEIGVDDALVALHLVGRAVGDLAAVVEHHDPV